MKYYIDKNMKNKSYTILPVEFLAIVSNDESGIFQVMSFDTKRELDEFAEKCEDDLNHVTKYKAIKLP